MSNPRRPNKKTVLKVVTWLQEELGLSLYGQCADTEAGIYYGSLMDYDIDQIEQLYKHLKDGTMTNDKSLEEL